MKIQHFVTTDMRSAIRKVRDTFGPDGVILSTRRTDEGLEVTAAIDYEESAPATSASARAQAAAPARMAVSEPVEEAARRLSVAPALDDESRRTAAIGSGDIRPGDIRPGDTRLGEVEREIRSLRSLLEEQVGRIAWSENERARPLETELRRRLGEVGLQPRIATTIARAMPRDLSPGAAWARALRTVEANIPVAGEDPVEEGGIIALVGATGVGKTTTVAKLAARYAMRHGPGRVAMITTDGFRIGAPEQLRIFGRIIDIPVQVAADESELQVAVEQFHGRGLVLIDTAGMSQRDIRFSEQIDLVRRGSPRARIYLALSATTHYLGLKEVIRRFDHVAVDGCVITKTDECTGLGDVLSVVLEHKLPLAYVSDGQRVPEDLRRADPQALVAQATDLAETHARSMASEARLYGQGATGSA